MAKDRHFCQHPSALIWEVAQCHATNLWQCTCNLLPQPISGTFAGKLKPRKPGQIQHANIIAHRFAFFSHPLLPWAGAGPGLGGLFRGVIACFCKPVGALPAVVGAHLSAKLQQFGMVGGEFAVSPCRPFVMREVHGVLVAVHLLGLIDAVLLVRIIGVTSRIDSPHVPLGLPVDDPFRRHFARTAALRDAEGEGMGFKRIGHAGHGANHGQTIRGIGNRPIDVAFHPLRSQQGHTCHGIFDVKLQPLQIIRIKLEAEILRHWIIRRCPCCPASTLIRAQIEPARFLPQIVGGIRVTQHGQFAAMLFGPGFHFGDCFCHEVLMAHGDGRHAAPAIRLKPFPHTGSIITRRIHHVLAADLTRFGADNPFAALPAHARGRRKAQDAGTQIAGALGKGLCHLRRVDIAVQRIPKPAFQIMRFHEGEVLLQLVRRAHVHGQAHVLGHGSHVFKLHHPFMAVRQPDGPSHMIVDGVVDLFRQPAIQL
ncbi:hypothetical protein PJE062_3916 [Pseudovibrio sp. JE062]|nr:hypothetical protein PJE062_3916 [Pseudovibrio sp. JE062]